MANNDYWAYLRNENELKHAGVKGMKKGQHIMAKDPQYLKWLQNIGARIGGAVNNIKDASEAIGEEWKNNKGTPIYQRVEETAKSLPEAIRRKRIQNNANRIEAKRTSYADTAHWGNTSLKSKVMGRGESTPDYRFAYGARKLLENEAEDASQKRKAALEEEYRNNHRDAQTERPQDRMKEGQAKARQEAEERKMYEDWLAEQEKAKKRKESLARNTANMQRWGYKD